MEALRFELKGKTAFFKNPEVNTYQSFTFGHIHKPALLGLLGAVLGYKGYGFSYGSYLEYYERLKDLKVSIIPGKEDGHFTRKTQSFNNSVGYASKEQGGNLIIKEQWLEDVSWTVYVLLNDSESEALSKMMTEHRCIYIPYLGKNDHPATIESAKRISLEETDGNGKRLHCLFPMEGVSFDRSGMSFKYEEYLPYTLEESTNLYNMKKFALTDARLEGGRIYRDGDRNLMFY